MRPKMITVWRLENEQGVGVFSGNCVYKANKKVVQEYGEDYADDHAPSNHPSPYDIPEMKTAIKLYYNCGFESIEQYHMWFTKPYRQALENVSLCTYKVSPKHVRKGGCQVMFDRSKAVLVERRSPAYADYENNT